MLFFITLVTMFSFVLSFEPGFEPSCKSCKWFIPKQQSFYSLCGFYKNKQIVNNREYIMYEFASTCRQNNALCGPTGYMYEPQHRSDELTEAYEELKNRCCGEVNEKNEIEQLEREMFEIMLKIKRHNTRNIYNTSKDLFKLLKQSRNNNNNDNDNDNSRLP